MKRIALLIFVSMFAMTLTSCNNKQSESLIETTAENNVNLPPANGIIDPFAVVSDGSYTDRYLMDILTGKLLENDPESGDGTFSFIGALAEELPAVSADGLTWTFRIREGLKFTDGTVIDAYSFENAVKKWLDPVMAYPSASRFWTSVKIVGAKSYALGEQGMSWQNVGIKTPNRLTLNIELEEPVPSPIGLNILNLPAVHPSLLNENAADFNFKNYPSSGLYKVVNQHEDNSMQLERNAFYPNAYLHTVNNINLSFSENNAVPYESIGPWFININTDNAYNPPLMDVNLRKALFHGLDRERILQQLSLTGIQTASFIPQDAWIGNAFNDLLLAV